MTNRKANQNTNQPRFMRKAEVIEKVGLSIATIYRLIKINEFPKPVKLASNSIAWLSTDVDIWFEERIKERDQGAV